mmetsp:Transcript_10757/g.26360  ORF Transcript_10757/g.26360 Transcript_10757/m.26360 type:complete len:289 (-) Transcript_10757:789-1655(-)
MSEVVAPAACGGAASIRSVRSAPVDTGDRRLHELQSEMHHLRGLHQLRSRVGIRDIHLLGDFTRFRRVDIRSLPLVHAVGGHRSGRLQRSLRARRNDGSGMHDRGFVRRRIAAHAPRRGRRAAVSICPARIVPVTRRSAAAMLRPEVAPHGGQFCIQLFDLVLEILILLCGLLFLLPFLELLRGGPAAAVRARERRSRGHGTHIRCQHLYDLAHGVPAACATGAAIVAIHLNHWGELDHVLRVRTVSFCYRDVAAMVINRRAGRKVVSFVVVVVSPGVSSRCRGVAAV